MRTQAKNRARVTGRRAWASAASAAAAVLMVVCGAAESRAQERMTIVAGKMVMPDGTLKTDMGVVIVGGKIERTAPSNELPRPAAGSKDLYVSLPDATISPGLIDLCSAAGAFGDTTERRGTLEPRLSALDAVDANAASLKAALHAGITSVMVTPSQSNVVSGAAATVRTSPKTDGKGNFAGLDVVRADGPMIFSLGPQVWNVDREPTSRSGSITLLRRALSEARDGKGDERLKLAAEGKLDVVIACAAAEDVDSAIRTMGEFGVMPVIMHTADGVRVAEELGAEATPGKAGGEVYTIVGPLDFTSSARELEAPAAYEKAGVDVGFCAQTPARAGVGLRATAALAAQYGMSAEKARRGMTTTAAAIAGVSGKIGSLSQGLDADVVIFSGDPLRLDSRVLQVYVKGVRVYSSGVSAGEGGSDDDGEN